MYILSLDPNFARFLDSSWETKTTANPTRGLIASKNPYVSVAQKNAHLELMLGQVANYCPVISRNSIIKNSISLNEIWQKIRQHFGFRSSGSHFLNLASIKRQPDERPEDLYHALLPSLKTICLL